MPGKSQGERKARTDTKASVFRDIPPVYAAAVCKKMKIKKRSDLLLVGERRYFVNTGMKQFSCEYGNFNLLELVGKEYGTKITTNKGTEFHALKPRLCDIRFKRMPQIVMPKDIGLVAGIATLGKKDVVIEAGTGSGLTCVAFANMAKKVYTYEVREDFAKVAEENIKKSGLKNIVLKNRDICGGIEESEVDLVFLDMGSPELAVAEAKKALTSGGFLVVYSPVIEQALRVRERIAQEGFVQVQTTECIKRDWEMGDNRTRPSTRMIGHTAFLTFARKV